MIRETINVAAYCDAVWTWARVDHRRTEAQVTLLREGCRYIQSKYSGTHGIYELCDEFRIWARSYRGGEFYLPLFGDVAKSCLLGRLLYAGEPLRTRPCPIHLGQWSGCPPTPCPAGCNFGYNLTGWLHESAGDE